MLTDAKPVGQNLRPAKAGEMIAAYLRGKIVRGELTEGESLPAEIELMRQFDVSRPTLREAFRILETESLIELRRGARGARIMAPSASVAARSLGLLMQTSGTTLADVYEARTLLETAAAGLLAERGTEADFAELGTCVAELEDITRPDQESPDAATWMACARRFHDQLIERAGNKTLAIQYRVLHEVVDAHVLLATRQSLVAATSAGNRSKVIKSFRKLLALARDHDVAGAAAHWRQHMDVVGLALLPEQLRSATVLDMFS